jgi:hypothetical protein
VYRFDPEQDFVSGGRPVDDLLCVSGIDHPDGDRLSEVQQRLDDCADLAADSMVDDAKLVHEPVAVDGADELALDVAGLVEARVNARFHLDMQ